MGIRESGRESSQDLFYTLWNCERKLKEIFTHICTFPPQEITDA